MTPRPAASRARHLGAVLASAALAALVAGCGADTGPTATPQPNARAYAAPVPAPRPSVVEPVVGQPTVAIPAAAAAAAAAAETAETADSQAGAEPAVLRDPEEALAVAPSGSAPSPGAPSDAEVRRELVELGVGTNRRAAVLSGSEALAPLDAPEVVRQVIAAANAIARTPYLWGGGHAKLYDRGYDCSGSLSFAFIQAGLLRHTQASGFSTMGAPGPGRWITVYASAGHVWMTVAGLRYDTSALHIAGSRWTDQPRPLAGFVVRHPIGL